MFSIFPIIFHLLFVAGCGLQIAAALLLLRDGGKGPWMMLGGAVLATIGQFSYWMFPLLFRNFSSQIENYYTASVLTAFGSTVFCIGLLLHALHRRGQGNRVAELEAVLAAIQKS